MKMQASFFNGTIRSIVIPELASIYAGDPRTGGRMEAMLQQLAGEGCHSTNADDSRWQRYEMRCTVFAAMTPAFATRKHQFWEEGFHRRFLWAHMAMENEEVLLDYLTANKQADMTVQSIVEPPERFIPNGLQYRDRDFVRTLLDDQKAFGPNHTRLMFLCRTAAVLQWHYARMGNKKDWRDTLKKFSSCLSQDAALLIVPPEPLSMKYRKQQEMSLLQLARTRRKVKHKRKPVVNNDSTTEPPPVAESTPIQ